MFFAFFIRKSDRDQEAAEFIDDDQLELNSHDEEYLHSIKVCPLIRSLFFSEFETLFRKQNLSPFISRSASKIRRLSDHEIAWARDQRLKQIRMWSIIREVAAYLVFVVLLYLSTYSNLNENSFYEVKHLRQFFLQPNPYGPDFTQVRFSVSSLAKRASRVE